LKKTIINGAVIVLLAFIMAVIMVYLYSTRENEDVHPSYIFNPEPGVEAAPLVSHPFFEDDGVLMKFIDGIEYDRGHMPHFLINNTDLYISFTRGSILEYFDEEGDVWRLVPMHTQFFFSGGGLSFHRPHTTNLKGSVVFDEFYYMIPGQKYRIRRTVDLTKRTADRREERMPHDFVLEFYWTDNPFQRVVPTGG